MKPVFVPFFIPVGGGSWDYILGQLLGLLAVLSLPLIYIGICKLLGWAAVRRLRAERAREVSDWESVQDFIRAKARAFEGRR